MWGSTPEDCGRFLRLRHFFRQLRSSATGELKSRIAFLTGDLCVSTQRSNARTLTKKGGPHETTPNEGGRNSTVVVAVRFFVFIETAPSKSGEMIISHGFCSQKILFGSFDFLFIMKSYRFVLKSRDEIKHDRKIFFFG